MDIASSDSGARVSYASSYHDEYPPSNVIDKTAARPWVTSGMYPQFIVITFPKMMSIRSVDLKTCQVREVFVEKSINESSATQFSPVTSAVFRTAGGNMQTESIVAAEEFAARHIKVVLKSGYDNFSAVYRISVSGETNLFPTTKVDTKFSFGSNDTTAASKFSSNEVAAPKTQPRQKLKMDDDEQQAYSFNRPPPTLNSAMSGGADPDETEEAGFQSTFRLPNDPTFGKRRQESVATTEDASGGDEEDDDDDAFVGVGGGVNWQL